MVSSQAICGLCADYIYNTQSNRTENRVRVTMCEQGRTSGRLIVTYHPDCWRTIKMAVEGYKAKL